MPWGPSSSTDALVSVQDYIDWYALVSPSMAEQNRIQMAIDMASDAVRSYTGQLITQASETVTLAASGNGTLVLPQGPVTAISAVTRDGVTLNASSYQWRSPLGVVTMTDGSSWQFPQIITVTYTHGYAQTPRDLAGVVLGRAKRWLDDPTGQPVQSETLGSWSVTYATSGEGAFTLDEQEILDRYSLWTYAY